MPHCNCILAGLRTRRSVLGAMGTAVVAGLGSGLPGAQADEPTRPGEITDALADLCARARVSEHAAAIPFRLNGADMPWSRDLAPLTRGQEVTFLLAGRWYVSRPHDLWLEPGVAFHARSGTGRIFNPMANTGTMTADRDGMLRVARSAGEWASPNGNLATPADVYIQAEGWIEGVALVWTGDARSGLRRLAAAGDVAGLVQAEIARLEAAAPLPPGWEAYYMFGNGAGTFRGSAPGEILCSTHKTVGILQHPVSHPLAEGAALDWRWIVEELPATIAENEVATHDYLSIAVEFDDGQDLTYMWSVGLPPETVFHCPLPLWTKHETHVVARSGPAELGRWLDERRNVYNDYKRFVGGDARAIAGVWLIANSVFLRRSGRCRYRDIVLSGEGWQRTVL